MKPDFSAININDYTYPLTEDRIARFPPDQRDTSKLLVWDGNQISHDRFMNVADYLPAGSLLVLNNTKVVHARLFFRKPTGALIEVFCLEPLEPVSDVHTAFQQSSPVTWKCLLGNARRWKEGNLSETFEHNGNEIKLTAKLIEKTGEDFLVRFSWKPQDISFAEVMESFGRIPLPPYLKREAVALDKKRYQTVYACHEGSVAAPTAGLHFTPRVFERLAEKNIRHHYLTLHVGAGTFKPVGDDGIEKHTMHTEQMLVSRQFIENLLGEHRQIIAVGTTSVRTLESLYWYGVKLQYNKNADFGIPQFDPYQEHPYPLPDVEQALKNILGLMNRKGMEILPGSTQLMIVPGYNYRIIGGMITNFHQPRSTLLLLIAAWLGDKWKDIYHYALENDFRFLSYGDSCLFL